jgi:uncharacterized membrane protein
MSPPYHPLIVHFPVALLTTAALLELCAVLFKREELSRAGWWIQLVGTVAILAAAFTGIIAENASTIPGGAAGSLDLHKELAFVCASAFTALLLWRVGARTSIPGSKKWHYVLAYCATVILLILVAWFGGELVYRFGVGTLVGQ